MLGARGTVYIHAESLFPVTSSFRNTLVNLTVTVMTETLPVLDLAQICHYFFFFFFLFALH